MKDLWLDPVILGASGVIAVGIVFLVLALRALMKSSKKPRVVEDFDIPSLRTPEPLSVVSPDRNPFSANTVVPPPTPVLNKEVVDKVDLISQRLVDMQMLLNKQVAASARAGANSPGLSPEMLDKLLTITSGVAQQIDVLQKALGGDSSPMTVVPAAAPATPVEAPPAVAPAPAAAAAPTVTPARSTPTMTPISQIIGTPAKPPPPSANT